MKLIKKLKIAFVFLMLLCISSTSNAQELGIRVGLDWGNAAAIDAVFNAGQTGRIHADLSFGNGVAITGIWNFIYKDLGNESFKWYAGVGLSTAFANSEGSESSSTFRLGIPGEIGLEYRFKGAPLALGLDWRPVFEIVDHTSLNAGQFGINFRYVFGK